MTLRNNFNLLTNDGLDRALYTKANRELFDFVKHLDAAPENARPVHFYFYSEEEADLYRLADELLRLDFKIVEVSQSTGDQWLCLAEMELVPEPEIMDRCTELLFDLAERYETLYDGWETRIDL